MNDNHLIDNPYVGPRPFENTEQDRKRFFGRTRETKELCSLILSHQVLLVYAPSGAGKTSLFNAKIIPMLKDEFDFQVLPVVRVRGIIADTAKPANAYIYNILSNIDNELKLGVESDLPNQSLHEYLEKIPREFNQLDEEHAHLALIFDQFEELFEFYPEGWQQLREDFFRQITDFCQADPRARVVFVMREDYLARMRPYETLLPERLEVRFRIELLGLEQTLEAIEKPLASAEIERRYVGKASNLLAEKLMRLLVVDDKGKLVSRVGDYVLPVQLQVACRTFWNKLGPDVEDITEEMIESYDVDQALADYYETAVKGVSKEFSISESKLRKWFEDKLITPMGTRSTIVMDLDSKTTAGIPNTVVEFLDSKIHILNKAFSRGAPWIELTHDQFVQPILKSNQKYREKQTRRRVQGFLAGGFVVILVMLVISISSLISSSQGTSQMNDAELTAAEVTLAAAKKTSTVQAQLLETSTLQAATSTAQAATSTAQVATSQVQAERTSTAQAQLLATSQAQVTQAVEIEFIRSIVLGNQVNGLTDEDSELVLLLSIEAMRFDNNINTYSNLLSNLIRQIELPNLIEKTDLDEHKGPVSDLVFSPDGSVLVSASWDSKIVIWDYKQQKQKYILEGHTDRVLSLAISPDNKLIASGGINELILWDLETGELLSYVSTPQQNNYGIDFSPDGQLLATASKNTLDVKLSSITLWNVSDDDVVFNKKIIEGPDAYWDVAFGPNSHFLAAANNTGAVRLWDLQEDSLYKMLRGHQNSVNKVVFSSNGQILASSSDDRDIILWDVSSGDTLATLEGHEDWVIGIDFYSNDDCLISASKDGTIRIWDLDSFTQVGDPYKIEKFIDTRELIYVVGFDPTGKLLASAIGENNITLWDVNSILPLETSMPDSGLFTSSIGHQLGEYNDNVIGATFSQDSKYIVTATENGEISVWDSITAQQIKTLASPRSSKIISVGFTKNEILVLYSDGALGKWDWQNQTEEPTLEVYETIDSQKIELAAISPDGTLYAKYDPGNLTSVIETETGKQVFWRSAYPYPVVALAVESKNQLFAIGFSDNIVEIRDLVSKEIKARFNAASGSIQHISFSPDGSLLATALLDGKVCLWGSESGGLKNCVTHDNGVIFVLISNDNRRLITADVNHQIFIWDIESRSQIGAPLVIHNETITGLAISPDGNRLVSTSIANGAILWELSSNGLEILACHQVERNLTREEFITYFGEDFANSQKCPNLP